MDKMQKHKQEMSDWADEYEKAIKNGVFDEYKESKKKTPATSRDVKDDKSYKTFVDGEESYWEAIRNASKHIGAAPDPLKAFDVLNEAKKSHKEKLANKAKTLGDSANPVVHTTVGVDQSGDPEALGATYSNEDLEKINDLKLDLHSLQDKLNALEGLGDKSTKIEGQIGKIKDEIDKLSTMCTNSNDSSED